MMRSRLKRATEEMSDQVSVAVGLLVDLLEPVNIAFPIAVRCVFFPANGGLPTIASKPGFSRPKTSGNSISQWNGVTGRSPERSCSHGLGQRLTILHLAAGAQGTRPACSGQFVELRSSRALSLSAEK